MARKIIVLVSYCILFFAMASSLFAVVRENESPTPAESYVPNQIIVKYKEGSDPVSLQIKIAAEKESQKGIIGFFRSIWQNITTKFDDEDSSEEKLKRIEDMDKKIGVVKKEKLYENPTENSMLNTTYLLTTNGSMTVENAIKEYETLPEVEYAEPNQIMEIQTNEAF